MKSNSNITIVDVGVSAGIILIVVSLMTIVAGSYADGGAEGDETSRQDDSDSEASRKRQRTAMKLRSIANVGKHLEAMAVFGESVPFNYPGLTLDEKFVPKVPTHAGETAQYGSANNGSYPATRLAILLNTDTFKPTDAISPFDTSKRPAKVGTRVTRKNFSYAMLQLPARLSGRMFEWAPTENMTAASISDRNIGGPGDKARSINSQKGSWEGAVGFNDRHVEYLTTNRVKETRYTSGWPTKNDDLFADDDDGKGEPENDAAMVYHDAKTYTKQK